MYRMLKGETVLATVTNPVWVRKQDNGSYGLCEAHNAQGVVLEGTVYHLDGKDELEGTETVVLGEISEAAYQKEQAAAQEAKQIQSDTALAELSILIASALPYSE